MAIQSTVIASPPHGIALIEKVARRLAWMRVWLHEFGEHVRDARADDVERVAFALLSALADAHESLLDATWHLGARRVRDELLELRTADPLLAYFWKAGSDIAPDRLLSWVKRASATEVVVVDASRTLGWSLLRDPMFPGRELEFLFRFLYGVGSRDALAPRIDQDPTPLPGREDAAGVRVTFALDTVRLRAFDARDAQGHATRVAAPSSHLGTPLDPAAHAGFEKAICFYESSAKRLRTATDTRR